MNSECGRATLRYAASTGVIPRTHRKPVRDKGCVVFHRVTEDKAHVRFKA